MLGEIYWNDLPARVTRIGKKDNEIFILFEGKINGYGRVQSGRVILKKTNEFQIIKGIVEYTDVTGKFILDYILEGSFEDKSYEIFSGTWKEEECIYQFEISLEPEENGLNISQQDEKTSVSEETISTKEPWAAVLLQTEKLSFEKKLDLFFKEWRDLSLIEEVPEQPLCIDSMRLEHFFQNFDLAVEPIRVAKKQGFALNVWKAAGLKKDEVKNGQVLKWFLDWRGDHGQENEILKMFLEILPEQFHPPENQTLEEKKNYLMNYSVTAESHYFAVNDLCMDFGKEINDQSIRKNSRIDIEIDAKEFLLFIEVKINANEGKGQLQRYYDIAKKRADGRKKWAIVYLTKDGKLPKEYSASEYIGISWTRVSEKLSEYAEQEDINNRGAWLAKQFADHIKSF
ncbi:PD-(D/E)XK nuclease family protein [Acinetobacter gyllenbergii]|uniref:PDDEXK-like family protein n=1 Tax=Acinetobacter gyllenbergii TaxID=134534 RepID=UPI0021D026E8|nr:PD-(D/E)XK nuclease family protein [Acinetobacter gyllenbergii]MCU4582996.1 PD-(D/E)XK nuclease family protein [Acinetobacter gyllenbergii]